MLDGHERGDAEYVEDCIKLLFNWTFDAGKYQTGWGILKKGICGLATLTFLPEVLFSATTLKNQIQERFTQADSPSQEIRDRTAREIRREVAAFTPRNYSWSPIERSMNQIDREPLERLLLEFANLLSPNATNEPTPMPVL